jgi:hypothetical protein
MLSCLDGDILRQASCRDNPIAPGLPLSAWFWGLLLGQDLLEQIARASDAFPAHSHQREFAGDDGRLSVIVPERRLCCGRPLYDYGMLDLAKCMLL